MKNIEVIKNRLQKLQNKKIKKYISDVNDDTVFEVIENFILEEFKDLTENIDLFENIEEVLKWCGEDKYTIRQEVLTCLKIFNKGSHYEYIRKISNGIYLHNCIDYDYSDEIDLLELGFEYDDFDFLEENKSYYINELVNNAIIKGCGN